MMRTVQFGDLFISARNGLAIKQDKSTGGLPITRIETISRGVVDPHKVGFAGVPNLGCEQWLLHPGDILFSHINSLDHLGKCALYEGVPEKLIHGMNLVCLRCDPDVADARYVTHLIRSQYFRQKLLRVVNASVNQVSVSLGNLRALEVKIPGLSEQKRIAAILDKADALRRKRRESIAKLDTLLQSVFMDMFGDPHLTRSDWPRVALGELGELDRGRSRHRPRNAPELYGGCHPFVQTGDVANAGRYITTYRQTYSDEGLKQSRLWPKGTLCVTIAANIAKTAILNFDACFPDSVVGFTPGSCARTEYVRCWFTFIQKRLEDLAPESAQKNINLETLRGLVIAVPPLALQQRFSAIDVGAREVEQKFTTSLGQIDQAFYALQTHLFRGPASGASS